MPFGRPDLPTLLAQTETLLLGDLPQMSPVVRRLILRAIARTQAGLVWSEHGYLVWLAAQLMPDQAESDYLARWATIFNGRSHVLRPAPAHPAKPAAAGILSGEVRFRTVKWSNRLGGLLIDYILAVGNRRFMRKRSPRDDFAKSLQERSELCIRFEKYT